jgi:hypothetical protein
MRKKTFLSEPDWMTIPFQETRKTPFHQMLDILLSSPELMDRAELIKRERVLERRLELCLGMADTCWNIERKMQRLYSNLEAVATGQLYWPSVSSYSALDDQYPFSTKLEFVDRGIGLTLTLYWAALTVLWSGMCELYELIDRLMAEEQDMTAASRSTDTWPDLESTARKIGQRPLDHRTQFIMPARKVCQSVEYFMNDDFSLAVLLAPLGMISHILPCWPGFEAEMQWTRRALVKIQQRGVELARHFPEQVVIGGPS